MQENRNGPPPPIPFPSHTHTHTHARISTYVHTHTHYYTHTHARMHRHTHTHTHTCVHSQLSQGAQRRQAAEALAAGAETLAAPSAGHGAPFGCVSGAAPVLPHPTRPTPGMTVAQVRRIEGVGLGVGMGCGCWCAGGGGGGGLGLSDGVGVGVGIFKEMWMRVWV